MHGSEIVTVCVGLIELMSFATDASGYRPAADYAKERFGLASVGS